MAVGNEIDPNTNEAKYILPAMTNIQNKISSANLQGRIKVSTAIYSAFIAAPAYPPSTSVFRSDVEPYIKPSINFLGNNGSPLLANVYPYFAYFDDHQQNIKLEYALFTQQGINNAGYQNLFDAMLDSIYAAVEKVGAPNLKIVVSESGWSSEGEDGGASIENAGTYYSNLINHVSSGNGTPKRPGPIETYLFAMFDENQKPGERHVGLFRSDKSPKYQLRFNN